MLRIAVPNKGTLSESATTMLREAGYKLRTNSKTLVSRDDAGGIEFFYLRPRDIAVYIGEGILDLASPAVTSSSNRRPQHSRRCPWASAARASTTRAVRAPSRT